MEITSGFDLSAYGMVENERTALTRPNDFGRLVARSIDEQQAEKEEERQQGQEPGVGLPFPGQLSQEERQRIENLKNEAMQIASQAKGDLTPHEQSQIKAIQQEISDIGGMPMSENMVQKAKGIAEANKAEKAGEAEGEEAAMNGRFASDDMDAGTGSPMDAKSMAGIGMLRQRALATTIKALSGGFTPA